MIKKIFYAYLIKLFRLLGFNNWVSNMELNLLFDKISNSGFDIQKNNKHYSISNKIFKTNLRKDSSDIYVFDQIMINHEYESLVSLIHSNKFAANVIIDLGANIGLTTLYLKNAFPDSKIICLEPDVENYQMLQKNISLNNNNNGVIPINAAIWHEETELQLDKSFRDGKDWSLSFKQIEGKGRVDKINAITLSSIIQSYSILRIDLLKIDIEGAERFILNKKVDLNFLSITKVIAVEIHDEFNCREDIYAALRESGFVLFNSGELTIGINPNL